MSKPKLEGVPREERIRMDPDELYRIRTEDLLWTQARLAMEIGVSEDLVYRWEAGRDSIPESREKHIRTLRELTILRRDKADQVSAGGSR